MTQWYGKSKPLAKGAREKANVFAQREKKNRPLDWREVDQVLLRATLMVCMESGVTLSFAPAQGGIGVTLRFYQGNSYDDAYAGDAEQLCELLALLLNQFASGSEDPIAFVRGVRIVRGADDQAAD